MQKATTRLGVIKDHILPESTTQDQLQCITNVLKKHKVLFNESKYDGKVRAGVLIPLIIRNNELCILFTKRSSVLRSNPGQISFPGGKEDPDDPSILHTTLREAEEEIGLQKDQVTILGQLEVILSQRCYEVCPYVGLVSPTFIPKINFSEVEQILFVPISKFLEPHSLLLQPVHYGVIFTQIFFQVDTGVVEHIPKMITTDRLCHIIFGMTGAWVLRLLQLTLGVYQDKESLNAFDFHHQTALVYDGTKVFPSHEKEVIVV